MDDYKEGYRRDCAEVLLKLIAVGELQPDFPNGCVWADPDNFGDMIACGISTLYSEPDQVVEKLGGYTHCLKVAKEVRQKQLGENK